MRSDDILLTARDAGESVEVDEFGERAIAHVEEGEDAGATHTAGEGAHFEESFFLVAGVDAYGFADDGGAKDDCFALDGAGCHLGDQVEIVLTGFVGEIDGTSGDAAAGGVEGGVGMRGLEHVPIGQDVEMACQERVVGIDEDVPRMGARYARKEIIAVADHETGLVGR